MMIEMDGYAAVRALRQVLRENTMLRREVAKLKRENSEMTIDKTHYLTQLHDQDALAREAAVRAIAPLIATDLDVRAAIEARVSNDASQIVRRAARVALIVATAR